MLLDFNEDRFKCNYTSSNRTNDKYELKKLIGSGNFGKVYTATIHKYTVSIKITSKSKEINGNEVTTCLQFTKWINYEKYFPKIFCIYEDKHKYYIVMEYFEYGHLTKTLVDRMGINNFIKVVKKLLKILNFMHSQKFIFNDIKLENIVVGKKYKTRIIDYGLVTKFDNPLQNQMGTPIYFPPGTRTNNNL